MPIADQGNEYVERLRRMSIRIQKNEASDIVFGEMAVEFASLILTVADKLDETQHRVRRLNVLLVVLTVVLVIIPIVELIKAFR